jgi:hypothetical protein
MLRPEQFLRRLRRASCSPGYAVLTVSAPVAAGDGVMLDLREYWCVESEATVVRPLDTAARTVPVSECEGPESGGKFLAALEELLNLDPLSPVWAWRRSATELVCVGRGVSGRVSFGSAFSQAGNGWGKAELTGRRGMSRRPFGAWGATRRVEAWEAERGVVMVTLGRRPKGFVTQVRDGDGKLLAFVGHAQAHGRVVVLAAQGDFEFEEGMVVTVIAY